MRSINSITPKAAPSPARRGGLGWGQSNLALNSSYAASPSNPTPTLPCTQGRGQSIDLGGTTS
jgi:hypothetical protein